MKYEYKREINYYETDKMGGSTSFKLYKIFGRSKMQVAKRVRNSDGIPRRKWIHNTNIRS